MFKTFRQVGAKLKGQLMDSYLPVNESNNSSYKELLWDIAKGLQEVDGLCTSHYLDVVSVENIKNHLSYDQVTEKLHAYYGSQPETKENLRQKEADIVAAKITEFLDTHNHTNGIPGLLGAHEFLFSDVLGELVAGRIRKNNIFKKEAILNGDTVTYGDSSSLRIALEILFEKEKKYEYSYPLTEKDVIHLSEFTSELWSIHPFAEGNTRTTAVYIILYMNNKGFEITNDMFRKHSLFFRNALVRSAYENLKIGVRPTNDFLIDFYKNLFWNETKELVNDNLQLPINKNYRLEIQEKLERISQNDVTNSELSRFSTDKNVEVRNSAINTLKKRRNDMY